MATTTPHTPADEDFDPARVPVFPVITVEILQGHEQVLVDGRTHSIPSDASLTDTAIEAAAAAVRSRRLDYCRVAAILDDTTYPMIVGADGSRYDTSTDPRGKKRRRWTRPTGHHQTQPPKRGAWLVVVLVVVFATAAAGVAALTIQQFRPTTEPTVVAVPQATPTELPVLPPEGWTTRASWYARQVNVQQPVALPVNDVLLAVTADDHLSALDTTTGVPRWAFDLHAAPTAGPVRTSINGVAAVSVVTPRELLWWPLDTLTQSPRHVPLTAEAKVSFDGGSPLVVFPGQHAAVITATGELSQRLIPAGAVAVRADDDTVTALDPAGRLWQLDTPAPRVPDPIATVAAPEPGLTAAVLGTTAQHLVLAWRSATEPGATLAVVDRTGHTLTTRSAPNVGSDPWHTDGKIATAAGHLITFDPARIVPIADPGWRTTQITAGIVYGTLGPSSATLDATGRPHTTQDPAATAPIAADAQHAYVVTDTPAGLILYALERR